VPALRGRTLAGAIKLLGAANCSAGHVTRVWSTRFRKGRVIRSVAPSGTAAGAKVALVVSKDKKPRHHR
jgi:beta-lactam-binding protein with PASTA domain